MNTSSGATIRGTHASSRGGGSEWGIGQSGEFYDIEPRVATRFVCEAGHEARYEFHDQAELPTHWTCKRCGASAVRLDPPISSTPAPLTQNNDHQPVRPGAWYTHNHLRAVTQRRTTEELEALLEERLAIRRAAIAAVPPSVEGPAA